MGEGQAAQNTGRNGLNLQAGEEQTQTTHYSAWSGSPQEISSGPFYLALSLSKSWVLRVFLALQRQC